MNTLNNRITETHHPRDGSEFAGSRGSAASSLVEQWRFPLGSHSATLTITSDPGCEIWPEDMDALLEIGLLFKASILRRHRERSARTGVASEAQDLSA